MKMTRKQCIEELEVFIEAFGDEFGVMPICLTEAVRILKEKTDIKKKCQDVLEDIQETLDAVYEELEEL